MIFHLLSTKARSGWLARCGVYKMYLFVNENNGIFPNSKLIPQQQQKIN